MAEFSFSDLIGKVVDKATGVFDRVVDLELSGDEARIARDTQLISSAKAAEQEKRRTDAGFASTGVSALGGISLPMAALIGGGALLAVLLIARR